MGDASSPTYEAAREPATMPITDQDRKTLAHFTRSLHSEFSYRQCEWKPHYQGCSPGLTVG
jgi:hypothetical protein